MEKENNLEKINVGIVGHIDHGKTTLLHALTGIWASRHSEELKRGITIKLGYADTIIYKDGEKYNVSKKGISIKHISFVDAPGHEMLMATMLSGAAIIDAAILVVAVNEGIKPQTKEHLLALQAKKIKKLIVVQNKIDLVDKKKALENYKEIKELLKNRFDDAVIIPFSAQQKINLDILLKVLAEIPIIERKKEGIPIFIVARSFDINRPGTSPENLHGVVLGGTLKQGLLKIGEEIEIKPGRITKEANQYHYKKLTTKVVKLFEGSKEVKILTPGGSSSIETELDMSLGKNDLLSGRIVSLVNSLPETTTNLKIKFTLFKNVDKEEISEVKVSEILMFSINTLTTGGIIKKIKGNESEISLKVPIVPTKGDTVGIARNINNHWRLIGYGEII